MQSIEVVRNPTHDNKYYIILCYVCTRTYANCYHRDVLTTMCPISLT